MPKPKPKKPTTKKKPVSKTNFPTFQKIPSALKDIKNPKSKARLVLDIFLILIVIGIIGLILYENNRHHKLQVSAEQLKANLEAQGLRISDVDTGCKKSGKGKTVVRWHQCTMVFTHRDRDIQISEANKRIEKINSVMAAQDDYTMQKNRKKLQYINKVNERRPNSGMRLVHESTERACSLYYDTRTSYVTEVPEQHVHFDVIFTCDDDSWFNKTFRN